MTRYIVSEPGIIPGEYKHDAVKLAYKAGAVVEFFLDSGWKKLAYPSWFSDEKYRAIITDDMPQEIQELVNCYVTQTAIPNVDVTAPIKRISASFGNYTETTERSPKRRKWADVIIAMANGETGQWLHDDGEWVDAYDYNPMSFPEYDWRIKPRTIKIGDTEVPAPETKAPERGQRYYFVDPLEEERLYGSWTWNNDEHDQHLLRSGMIHLTPQAAQEHALALIKISGGQHPENYEVAK